MPIPPRPKPAVPEVDQKKLLAALAQSESGQGSIHPFICRIEIENFRNFHNFAVDLEPTSVIVGENKVGKSNLLEAIRLVLDPALPDAARKLRPEDFWDGLQHAFAGNTITIRVFIRNFEGNKGAQAILSECIVSKSPLTAQLTYQYRPKRSLEKLDKVREQEAIAALDEDDYDFIVFGAADENVRVGSDIRKWITLVVLPALRDAEGDIQSWRRSPLRPLLDRVKKGIPAKHFVAVRKNLDDAKATLLQAKLVAELVASINERVRHLAGPVHAVETELDFASSEPEQLVRSLRIFLREKSSKPLSDASLGTANILFLALLLQDMEMKQEAREIVSTILAIEEPEAHLHPQLQRLLFRYFLGRKHPILLTTHSPNIAGVAPIDSVVLLRVENGETHGFSSRDLAFTPEQKHDLQRYLDVTRAEILFARGVIFVEGVAEQFLIPAFANSYMQKNGIGTSLDDLGISVCSVNGTDFTPYRSLLSQNGLAIPNVVITDGDPRPYKPDRKILKSGLRRGALLVYEETERKKLFTLHTKQRDEATVAAALPLHGIFVNDKTLEIDLLEGFASEMKATYSELANSEEKSQAFSAEADAVGADSAQAEALLARIERIGKGRFAQRLAGKLNGKNPPAYIQKAIRFIIDRVTPSNAKPK
ncbi:MAG: nucleoside triphosphate hydrolase [Pedosphaera sp.]|nr:nucleoside triphosphate hydrolase [Pedosphaera sp.]